MSAGVRTNAGEVARELTAVGVRAGYRAASVTRHFGMLLQARVQAAASGRPGPRAQTGDYRRAWHMVETFGAGAVRARVQNNSPQAWRLEAGYVGTDVAGRVVDQPPYPHAGPAFDRTAPEYTFAVSRIVD